MAVIASKNRSVIRWCHFKSEGFGLFSWLVKFAPWTVALGVRLWSSCTANFARMFVQIWTYNSFAIIFQSVRFVYVFWSADSFAKSAMLDVEHSGDKLHEKRKKNGRKNEIKNKLIFLEKSIFFSMWKFFSFDVKNALTSLTFLVVLFWPICCCIGRCDGGPGAVENVDFDDDEWRSNSDGLKVTPDKDDDDENDAWALSFDIFDGDMSLCELGPANNSKCSRRNHFIE